VPAVIPRRGKCRNPWRLRLKQHNQNELTCGELSAAGSWLRAQDYPEKQRLGFPHFFPQSGGNLPIAIFALSESQSWDFLPHFQRSFRPKRKIKNESRRDG
jgi:hypothetical protein